MKKQKQSKLTPRLTALLLILAWAGLGPQLLSGQTTSPITDDGYIHTYTSNKKYTDITIPAHTTAKYLYLEMKGGDGGQSNKNGGGKGATAWAYFKIGVGDHLIKPGSKIRLFPGQKGQDGGAEFNTSGEGVGGGGGGASGAVIYYPSDYDRVYPNNQVDDTPWKKSLILMVAGGGGGGGAGIGGRPGSLNTAGTTGYDHKMERDLGNGGSNGTAGGSDGDASGGASWFQMANRPSYQGNDGEPPQPAYRNGLPTGGPGGEYINSGGWGFAGGGNTDASGGGGGGYSGGGGGDAKGRGGGGGSYITHYYSIDYRGMLIKGSIHTDSPTNGYVKYGLVDLKTIKLLANDGGYCMDNSDGQFVDNNNIQLWTCQDGNNNQKWLFDNFQIKPALGTHKCVDLDGSNQSNGRNIQLFDCNGTNAQKWFYDGQTKQLRYVANPKKCLDLDAGNIKNAANIRIWDCVDGHTDQQWDISGAGLLISAVGSVSVRPLTQQDKCIDNEAGSSRNNNNIHLWDCQDGNQNQVWTYNDAFIRWSSNQNKCLDLDGSNTINGRNIQLFDCNGTDAQKWFYDVSTNQFRSKVDLNKCLDVSDGEVNGFSRGTNIQLWDCMDGNPNQQFMLK